MLLLIQRTSNQVKDGDGVTMTNKPSQLWHVQILILKISIQSLPVGSTYLWSYYLSPSCLMYAWQILWVPFKKQMVQDWWRISFNTLACCFWWHHAWGGSNQTFGIRIPLTHATTISLWIWRDANLTTRNKNYDFQTAKHPHSWIASWRKEIQLHMFTLNHWYIMMIWRCQCKLCFAIS